jgi:hypothetical protein
MCPEFMRLKDKWEYLTIMLEEDYSDSRAEQVELARTEMEIHTERCDICNGEEHAIAYWQKQVKVEHVQEKIKFNL